MLLAVAGLDKKQIADRTKKLADGDWASFPPAERAGFAFARKATETPEKITPADIAELRAKFGPDRMMDVVWWTARCQYMTKVADAFQLPLEKENVFAPPK